MAKTNNNIIENHSENSIANFSEVVSMIHHTHQEVLHVANKAMVDLYWRIGQYISLRVAESSWGKGIVEELANYISINEPKVKGFSAQNLWRMKQFYEVYAGNEKLSALLREISWTNNMTIISRTKSAEEREFYIRLTIKERLSSRDLERQFKACTFEWSMLSHAKLSSVVREIAPQAEEVFKDQYVLEFITGKEAKPENSFRHAIIAKMKTFILELGKDFLFIDQEYQLQVGNQDFRIDLLFYHRELQCLVVFELKTDVFQPEHLGQLNFYLEALDRDVKKEKENPSIGVLLCKSKDNDVVEYALSRSMSPTMVAEYQLHLPDKKLLQQRMNQLFEQTEEEINKEIEE
jgi:predicted nuclease of restriction endonuclease-like (RecB) superfamily